MRPKAPSCRCRGDSKYTAPVVRGSASNTASRRSCCPTRTRWPFRRSRRRYSSARILLWAAVFTTHAAHLRTDVGGSGRQTISSRHSAAREIVNDTTFLYLSELTVGSIALLG